MIKAFSRLICQLPLGLFLFLLTMGNVAYAQSRNQTVYVTEIDGAIGPATHSHLTDSLRQATQAKAQALIITLDTPGGLASSMREMTKAILSAPLPVIVYVSPSGSKAASAGAFLVYAGHLASMAPGTNIGAASPIPLGGDAPIPTGNNDVKNNSNDNTSQAEEQKAPTPDAASSAAQRKAVEDLTAYMRAMAEANHRNVDAGISMILEGRSFSAQEALNANIVDFISTDLQELLTQLNGKQVFVQKKPIVLQTKHVPVVTVKPNWRYDFLSIITDPNITYLLMIAGIYGLLFEFYSPGVLFPGILGAICLILAGYGLHLLPINFAGLFLLLIGLCLLIAETFVTSYGILGLGGLVAFVTGSVFLLDTLYPVYSVSRVLIAIMATLSASVIAILVNFVFGSLSQPDFTGSNAMVGKRARAIASFTQTGQVECEGVTYTATSDRPVKKGEHVIITSVSGIKLSVTPQTNPNIHQ